MSDIDINRFLNKFGMNSFNNARAMSSRNVAQNSPSLPSPQTSANSTTSGQNIVLPPSVNQAPIIQKNLQIQGLNKAVYARDLFQMPRNMNEFIYMMQRGLTQAQFNQMFANQYLQRNSMSQMQAQILAQLQGGNIAENSNILNSQLNSFKNLEILSNGLINLNDLSLLFQRNGKDALAKVILAMTEASKSGITDLSQIKEMARLVNASIAVASENNPSKTMKLLIMLYLPWLPLQEGVGFDIEIESTPEEEENSENILVITITTIHFGIVKATLLLDTSNSIQTIIECAKSFPKQELEEKIKQENKKYSMESTTSFIESKETKADVKQASVTMNTSNATKVNPFLLLLAQIIIRNVIELDNNSGF